MKKNIWIIIAFITIIIFIGINKVRGQNNDSIKITSGKFVDNVAIGRVIRKCQLKKYGKIEVNYFKFPVKSKTSDYRWKSFSTFSSELFISSKKNRLCHRYKVKTISITIPLKAETEKGIKLGYSNEDDIKSRYGGNEGVFDETHEINFPEKEGKLVKYLSYESLGIRFYVDSVVYKIEVFKP